MKIVVIFSGGLDSTVLLNHVLRQGHEAIALSINYGQRHRRELDASILVVNYLNDIGGGHVQHHILDLSVLRTILGGSSQTSDLPVPHGHYAEESMKQTVVPNRNMIMLSVAAGLAISSKAQRVAYGAHAGDHAIYPDCRPEFAEAVGGALALCDWEPPKLWSPFVKMNKWDIVSLGSMEAAPMHLSYSCYEGGVQHCGKCGTCRERHESFGRAGVWDPTSWGPGLSRAIYEHAGTPIMPLPLNA